MAHFKEALSSLAPIPYDDLPSQEALPEFLQSSFAHAEVILNSIPGHASSPSNTDDSAFSPSPTNSAHNAQETFCDPAQVPLPQYETDATAVKGWGKPLKIGAKENPLGVQVYKMAAHDRHGAWFARRSIHQGLGFSKWRKAAQQEFLESLKVQEGPGSGSVRGVGADRRVERMEVDNGTSIDVWQTSSAFPGPVTPRESLTMVISSINALSTGSKAGASNSTSGSSSNIPRHFLVISRPTRHSDAPERPNLVKMEYESAEMIREVPIPGNEDPESNPIEWLMITRSDPGGGIPRFMVERGTPGSIVADVSKFLNWACNKTENELDEANAELTEEIIDEQNQKADEAEHKTIQGGEDGSSQPISLAKPVSDNLVQDSQQQDGLMSKVSGAVGETMSSYLPVFQQQATLAPDDSDTSSDISDSSDGTFRSAVHDQARSPTLDNDYNPMDMANDSSASVQTGSSATNGANSGSKHTRNQSTELTKLFQKRAALDERARKEQESFAKKAAEASHKEESQRTKMLEKQEKQRQKQEERYHKELEKLDARRIKEEKKEEERRRKAEAKDQMTKLKAEVSEWKQKAQIAEKEADLLRQQVETLQREQTAIVARLPEGEARSIMAGSARSRASSEKPGSTKSGGSGAGG